jgi:hypothetical protein
MQGFPARLPTEHHAYCVDVALDVGVLGLECAMVKFSGLQRLD